MDERSLQFLSVADLHCTNGVLRAPARFEIEWKDVSAFPDPLADTDGDGLADGDELFVHGTDPSCADTDGDGLSDGAETLAGADPLDPDQDRDGVPDGCTPAAWAANPLWPANGTNDANVTISLVAPIQTNAAATLLVGDLSIPLREPASWPLYLEPGQLYPYRLFVTDGSTASLSITNCAPSPPVRGATSWGTPVPLWETGSGDVFGGLSSGGEGELAIPVAKLYWDDPGDGSHEYGNSVCLHEGDEAVFTPSLLPAVAGEWTLDGFTRRGISFVLSVIRRMSPMAINTSKSGGRTPRNGFNWDLSRPCRLGRPASPATSSCGEPRPSTAGRSRRRRSESRSGFPNTTTSCPTTTSGSPWKTPGPRTSSKRRRATAANTVSGSVSTRATAITSRLLWKPASAFPLRGAFWSRRRGRRTFRPTPNRTRPASFILSDTSTPTRREPTSCQPICFAGSAHPHETAIS